MDAIGQTNEPAHGALAAARRVCLFAHWDPDDIVADHVLFQLDALRRAGFAIALASTSRLDDAQLAKLSGLCADVILRPNLGLDFGGWRDLFARHDTLTCDLLLLANDSVYGPLADLTAYIDSLTATDADLYAPVGSLEGPIHAQSWFVLLRPAAYRSPAFRALMAPPAAAGADKAEIIRRDEIGLTSALLGAGLRLRFGYDPRTDGVIARRDPFNAAHILWREVVGSGAAPFIKIELLRDNPLLVAHIARWQGVVRDRCPALVPMIEADLRRRPRRIAATTAKEAWLRYLRYPPSALRAYHGFLRRDYRLVAAGRMGAARMNAAAFAASALLLKLSRVPVRALGARRPVAARPVR